MRHNVAIASAEPYEAKQLRSRRPRRNSLQFKEDMAGYLFILPSYLGFLVFVLFPVLFSLFLSFTSWNFISGLDSIEFVGLKNFARLFRDEWFIDSMRNTLVYAFTTVPIGLAIALVLAAVINKYVFAPNLAKMLLFLPYISSIVAISVVWMVILHPTYGPVNSMLLSMGVENPPRWFVDINWALPSIIIMSIWRQLGYMVLVYVAGLKAISDELYEAADIDGANPVQKFFKVTIPMVSPATFFLLIMGMIQSFRVFDEISVITQGGPARATTVLAFYMYRTAFEYYEMGYASAITWAMFILIFAVTLVQWRGQKRFTVDQ